MGKTSTVTASTDRTVEQSAIRKVAIRLVPFVALMFFINYLDRTAIGFAAPNGMNDDLALSAAQFGFASGVFFIGYILLEVPSNVALHRFGARRWLARIMITWGAITIGMAFVQGPSSFYLMRFLLGVAEAGFFPAIVLYLTYWFPSSRRSKVTALFMTGIPMSGVIGGPLSGWLMTQLGGAHGLAGWQWLFLLQGLPTVLLGVGVLFYLSDGLKHATWLSTDEKAAMQAALDLDEQSRSVGGHAVHSFGQVLRNGLALIGVSAPARM